jgi:hypothetical protein
MRRGRAWTRVGLFAISCWVAKGQSEESEILHTEGRGRPQQVRALSNPTADESSVAMPKSMKFDLPLRRSLVPARTGSRPCCSRRVAACPAIDPLQNVEEHGPVVSALIQPLNNVRCRDPRKRSASCAKRTTTARTVRRARRRGSKQCLGRYSGRVRSSPGSVPAGDHPDREGSRTLPLRASGWSQELGTAGPQCRVGGPAVRHADRWL